MDNEKIFYHIYPLGFCGAPDKNTYHFEGKESLLKVIDWIPHMKYLGVNALYLGPLFESREHGYDTTDYYKLDSRLGTNATLKYLVNCLHENGIEVILDCVFNHVGRDFYAFKDLQNNLQDSSFRFWFNGLDFKGNTPFDDKFSYKTWNGHYNLIKLNLKNPETKTYLIDAAKYWIKEFDIDGLRLDAADVMDLEFLSRLSEKLKTLKREFLLIGEVVHGDYNNWINKGNLDSVTNYECYKGLYSSLNDKNYFEIAYSLNRQFGNSGCYKNKILYNFADNHDVDRVVTSLKNKNNLKNLYTMMFAMPGMPSIYYGSEWKLEGRKGTHNDFELRPSLDIDFMNHNKKGDLIGHLHKLSELRKSNIALKYGGYREILIKAQQFIFERCHENEDIYAVFNAENNDVFVEISSLNHQKFYDLLEGREITAENSHLKLQANSAMILKKIR